MQTKHWILAVVTAALIGGGAVAAQVQTFVGSGAGPIPDGQPGGGWGAPLVMQFNVSGLTRDIEGVAIIVNLQHDWAGDVSAWLLSPGGQKQIALFERLQATAGNPMGSGMQFDGQYDFGDGAAGDLWQTASQTGTIPPSQYRTSQPGPSTGAGSLTSMNAEFGGLTPLEANGTWTLLVGDFWETDTGTVNSAVLGIIQEPAPPPPPPSDSGGSKKKDDGGCSSNGGTGAGALAAIVAGAALLQRRKRQTQNQD